MSDPTYYRMDQGGQSISATHPMPVSVTSGGESASLDQVVNAQVTVDMLHHQIHLGHLYEASALDTNVADAGTFEVLVQTGLASPHLRGQFAAAGSARIQIYEGSAFSDAGTPVAAVNRNRNSANTAEATVTHTPTISDDGDLLLDDLLPGGLGVLGRSIGSSLSTFEEFVLKPSENYLLRLTNISGTASPVSISLAFYEVE